MKRRAEAGEETGLRVVEEEETEAEAGKQAEVEEEVEEASPGPGPRLVWTGGSSCGGRECQTDSFKFHNKCFLYNNTSILCIINYSVTLLMKFFRG